MAAFASGDFELVPTYAAGLPGAQLAKVQYGGDSTYRLAFLTSVQYCPLAAAAFGRAPVDVAMLTRPLVHQVRTATERTAYVRAKRVIFHNSSKARAWPLWRSLR